MFYALKAEQVNFFAIALVAGMFFYGISRHHQADFQAWHIALFICTVASLFAAIFNYWRLLKITEAPISSIAAAAQGYIELRGKTSTTKPSKTPFIGMPCVWYRAWVYAEVGDEDENGRSSEALIEYVESDAPFFLNDGTGTCLVNPQGAEVLAIKKRTQMRNNHRYVEEYLPAGEWVHVVGYLDTRHHFMSAGSVNHDMGIALNALKLNKTKLLNRYNQNLEGEIDLQEWEQVRADVRGEVEAQHRIKANDAVYMLSKPTTKQVFLVSALSPQALRKCYQLWSMLHFAILICLKLALFLIRTSKIAPIVSSILFANSG